jgi:membrane protein YqaA with SNARE-associated domain
MQSRDFNNRAADKFSQFSNSRGGPLILGAWAFLEPSFWFIAPDLCLWLMCLYSPKRYLKYFWITLASALAGAGFYFALNLFFFDGLETILMATPFVNEGMIAQIENILADYGLTGLLYQSFSFMSVKIWVHLAVENGIPFLVFITLTGLSRALRFLVFAWIFSRIGARSEGLLKRYFIPFVILYVLGFIGLLVFMETTFVLSS